ncbi:MAG: hypothetical protein M3Y59_11675 [Myxococcota bacterium]|nr:hypothetical protein [Myxococcota bacterium]
MAKAEKYEDLIFQLGDLARETLPNKPTCPRSMDRVYKAEDVVLARRDEVAQLEAQMNDEDAAFAEFKEQVVLERSEQEAIVKRFKRAVDAIQGRVKELRKKINTARAQVRYDKVGIKKMEQRHAELEMSTLDANLLNLSKSNLKKVRLATLRKERELEELQREFEVILTPPEGQPGAQGVLAHKRLLILEDEEEDRALDHDERMAELDALIATKEEELKASEEFLDQAVYMLGEDVYTNRIADPGLASLYPRLDNAR